MSHLRTTDPDGYRLDVTDQATALLDLRPGFLRVAVHAPDRLGGDGLGVDLDPVSAGQAGDALVQWAFDHGRLPAPMTQMIRWHLPDADVLAVLVERVLTGEDPTAENIERFEQAYREAHRVAVALPEVLGLLEELNPPEGCGPECSEMHTFEGRCEQAPRAVVLEHGAFSAGLLVPAGTTPEEVRRMAEAYGMAGPSEVPHCAGRLGNAHERRPMRLRFNAWWCPTCGETDEAEPGRPKVDDLDLVLDTIERFEANAEKWDGRVAEATRRLRAAVSLAALNRSRYVEPDPAQVDDLPALLQRLVDAWGALGVARLLRDGVPETDREAWLRSLGRPDHEHTPGDLPGDWTPPDPLGRDGDPVEDVDGAPLPDSVQALLRSAQDVVVAFEHGGNDFPAKVGGMRILVERVIAESRR